MNSAFSVIAETLGPEAGRFLFGWGAVMTAIALIALGLRSGRWWLLAAASALALPNAWFLGSGYHQTWFYVAWAGLPLATWLQYRAAKARRVALPSLLYLVGVAVIAWWVFGVPSLPSQSITIHDPLMQTGTAQP
ncbi:MAG: hypothetical protein IPL60_05335 [Ardenticatenia bacterium]|nr:hypothetical protein [Ardenticatenia bacterium]